MWLLTKDMKEWQIAFSGEKKFIASLTRLPDSALILRTFSPQFIQGEVCGQGSSSASATALEKRSSENNLPNGWKSGAVFQ